MRPNAHLHQLHASGHHGWITALYCAALRSVACRVAVNLNTQLQLALQCFDVRASFADHKPHRPRWQAEEYAVVNGR